MVKRIGSVLLLLAAIFSGSAQATITTVQHQNLTTCGTATTSCALTVTSTSNADAFVAASVVALANSVTLTAVTDNSGGGAAAWTHCTTCTATGSTLARSEDIWYALPGTGGLGATTITFTRSTSGTSWTVEFWEISTTLSSFAFDVGGHVLNASATSQPGVALTLTGTNDAILQVGASAANISSISTPYSILDGGTTGASYAGAINTASGTAPTWTLSSNGRFEGSAIALKEVASAPSCTNFITLMGAGCQ